MVSKASKARLNGMESHVSAVLRAMRVMFPVQPDRVEDRDHDPFGLEVCPASPADPHICSIEYIARNLLYSNNCASTSHRLRQVVTAIPFTIVTVTI